MKKSLFTFLSFFLMLSVYSQGGRNGWMIPNNSYGDIKNRQAVTKAFLFPSGCETPDSLDAYDLSMAALFYDTCNSKLLIWTPESNAWTEYTGGGGAGNLFSVVSNGDSTTKPFELIDGEGNSLVKADTINGAGVLKVNNPTNERSIDYGSETITSKQDLNSLQLEFAAPTGNKKVVFRNPSGSVDSAAYLSDFPFVMPDGSTVCFRDTTIGGKAAKIVYSCGGSSSTTLQQAYDNGQITTLSPPLINFHGNDVQYDSLGYFYQRSFDPIEGSSATLIIEPTSGEDASGITVSTPVDGGSTTGTLNVRAGESTVSASNDETGLSSILNVQANKSYLVGADSSIVKFGIGTLHPDSTLHVKGGLKFDLPSKGAGKVLTSDASGAATWQTQWTKQGDTADATISNAAGNIWYRINPYVTVTTQTITMPSTPFDGQQVKISFGGHITAQGTSVVNTFTVAPNSGQTVLGQTIFYSREVVDGFTLTYDSSNSSWYR